MVLGCVIFPCNLLFASSTLHPHVLKMEKENVIHMVHTYLLPQDNIKSLHLRISFKITAQGSYILFLDIVHLVNGLIFLGILQVLNLTEIPLNRVDIRVGLSGGLYFMDGSPQAVRQLRELNSQV